MDFFTVPTVTGRILFVFVVLLHHRRRIVHFNVTEHPTAAWTAQQVVEAFPDDTAPRWLLRDRVAIYGEAFRQRVAGMGIGEVLSAPSSPWQNPYAERLIGSIRRDCLNHVVVLGEQHLRRVLAGYLVYYHGSRTHLSLAKDAPTTRRVQGVTEGARLSTRLRDQRVLTVLPTTKTPRARASGGEVGRTGTARRTSEMRGTLSGIRVAARWQSRAA
jgi:putative transposase